MVVFKSSCRFVVECVPVSNFAEFRVSFLVFDGRDSSRQFVFIFIFRLDNSIVFQSCIALHSHVQRMRQYVVEYV